MKSNLTIDKGVQEGRYSSIQKDYAYYIEQQKAMKGGTNTFNSYHMSSGKDCDWLEFYSDNNNFEVINKVGNCE